ncbi:hypothetical protein VTO73DRAFT_4635 [Trametes versicolor]
MRDAPYKITARCNEVLLGRLDDADNDGKNRVGRGLNFESQSYPRRRLSHGARVGGIVPGTVRQRRSCSLRSEGDLRPSCIV